MAPALFFQNEYLDAITIVVLFGVVAFFLPYLLKIIMKKTKLKLTIVDLFKKKISLFIIMLGIFLALKSLTVLAPYYDLIDKIFFVILVFLVCLLLSRILAIFIGRWLKVKKRFEKTPNLVNNIILVIIYVIGVLIVLAYFNVEITPIIAALGVGGLAVGLALQSTLSNFFAGLHIISDKPINVGDYVELPESNLSGYVEDIGWRTTRIRTLPNTIVVVPNSKIAENVLVNDSMPQQEMAALVQVGVAYGSNLKKVEKVTVDVARKIQKTVPGAVKDFEPFIRYHTFGDSNINFTVILRVEKFVDKYLVTHEFIKALKERYDQEKIEISWPVRKIVQGKK